MRSPPLRKHGNWLSDIPHLNRELVAARLVYPTLAYRRRHGTTLRHSFTALLPIPGGTTRQVTAAFDETSPNCPHVFADGPADSPHRFSGRNGTQLCIWHPADPPERRWVSEDGLIVLFGMAQHHLFKEEWWRMTGEWLGDEAPHTPAEKPDAE